MSEAGAGQRGTRPASVIQALFEVGPDRLTGATNPAEVRVGPQGDDQFAGWAAVALEIQAAGVTLEVPRSEAVAPDPIMATLWTDCGPDPRIVLALLKNILEKNGDKIYHCIVCVWGIDPGSDRVESLPELSARFIYLGTKKGPPKRSK